MVKIKECMCWIQLDVLSDDSSLALEDRVEFTYQTHNDNNCIELIDEVIESMLQHKEIEAGNRYLLICNYKTEESMTPGHEEEFDQWLECDEIYFLDNNVIEKYHPEYEQRFDEKEEEEMTRTKQYEKGLLTLNELVNLVDTEYCNFGDHQVEVDEISVSGDYKICKSCMKEVVDYAESKKAIKR